VTEEPAQRGRREVRLALEASPRIALAYHRPAVGSDDSAALDVFENILSSGRTSRLYTSLVQRAKVAVSVSVSQSPMKYPSLFVVQCIPRRPHTVDDAATAIRAEIERMAREPANDWEMQKARNQIEADFLRALESTSELSTLVGTFEVIDRWTYLNTYIPRIRAVTPQDVMRVAHAYLKEENCTRVAIP
jgi:predicted Zn-dependent peptidase